MVDPIPDKRATTVADVFARQLIGRFGCPRDILSDRSGEFVKNLLHNLASIFRLKHLTTSGYHPQTNGGLERSHQVLADYLKHYMEQYENWDRLLPFAMLSYNASVHESTKFSPHEIVFGKRARLPTSFPSTDHLETYGSYFQELVKHLDHIRSIAANNLVQAKYPFKAYYDRRAYESNFAIGDYVYVLRDPPLHKFDKLYDGPNSIIEILELNNALLIDGNGEKFIKHLDKLKKAYLDSSSDSD